MSPRPAVPAPTSPSRGALGIALALVVGAAGAGLARADWPSWRGPRQDGVAADQNLISSWSPAGKNLAWRADLVGRSTPVVFAGRVCATGRAGSGLDRQETVACFDAASGKKLWERRLDIYLTAVPFSRVGWGNLAADPESGDIYDLGVGGLLVCFSRDGDIRWWRSLTEEFGLISGVGGRTHSPLVDENRLIVSFVSIGWGDQGPPRHRTYAFDKKSGELLWVAAPGELPQDFNTQTTPVAAVIGGQRLLIEGEADGWVHAIQARTGERVWRYHLSKGALNNTVTVHGDEIFASHGEENFDSGAQGRVVAIDGRGSGDVTKTHETWRNDDVVASFSTPLYHDGLLYLVDNSSSLACLDAASGKILWRKKIGRIGKASPVWGDGKLYVPEATGTFTILKPSRSGAEVLDREEIRLADGSRPAEIYFSPAIAYGRIFLSTEGGLFSLGDRAAGLRPDAEPSAGYPAESAETPASAGPPAVLHVEPAEVMIHPGDSVRFRLAAFDAHGRALPAPASAAWTLRGLAGTVAADGTFAATPGRAFSTGAVAAAAGGLQAVARVRVVPDLPWQEDFESIAPGQAPAGWVGAPGKFAVQATADGKVLVKPPAQRGLDRSNLYIGQPTLHDYTVAADLLGTQAPEKAVPRPDMGLIASGYVLDLQGIHQRLQVRAWDTELRLMEQTDFPWDANTWYTMKLAVDTRGKEGLIRAKVWRRGEPEPAAWTLTAHDPHPVRQGSPGLYGYSPAEIRFDNLKVTANP